MTNIFLSQPDTLSIETTVTMHRILDDGSAAIVAGQNPLRPAGGGQPADHGLVTCADGDFAVERVFKADGETWLVPSRGRFETGDRIGIAVDARRRLRLSQGHSLTHLAMAATRSVADGYESKGADIDEDGVGIELRFLSREPLCAQMVQDIDRRTRSGISRAHRITIERARSMAEAASHYPQWRVDPDLSLGGRIRVVVIEGIDANPCSGSHVNSTDEIGPYAMIRHAVLRSGVNILRMEKRDNWSYWY